MGGKESKIKTEPTSSKTPQIETEPTSCGQEGNWDYECSFGYKCYSHHFRNSRQTRVLVLSGTKIDDEGCYDEDTSSFINDVYTVLKDECLKDVSAFEKDRSPAPEPV